MALLERGYKAAATTELERKVRELEERDKTAQTKLQFFEDAICTKSNLNFAERLNLISASQADDYRQRILKAMLAFKYLQKTETRDDIVDGFENPRERAARYQKMESYNAQIVQARACVDQSSGSQNSALHDDERVR